MIDIELPTNTEALAVFRSRQQENRRLKGDARREADQQLRRARGRLVASFTDLSLQRALRDHAGETEPLVWFWFNHFNVFWQKGPVGAALPDYVDAAIRPNTQGSFRTLLLAALTHPAMLMYLDNAQNVAGKINENLARELLELHALGVDGGYAQADVREVARVLTGVGLRDLRGDDLPAGLASQGRRHGEFVFDPRRHEGGAKTVLGRRIVGEGFAEVESLVDLLATHPATARRVGGRLCQFLLGDQASKQATAAAVAAFSSSAGDLSQVVAAIHRHRDDSATRRTFKDPYRFVLSAVRLLSDGHELRNVRPLARWLAALGQPLYGCRTPDGYALEGQAWVSAGQMTERFEVARDMVATLPRLLSRRLTTDDVLATPAVVSLSSALGAASKRVMALAESGEMRLALLLSSPEFQYW